MQKIKSKICVWLGIHQAIAILRNNINSLDNRHIKMNQKLAELDVRYQNLVAIGVDVGIKDQTAIVIATKLNGGYVKIIDTRLGTYEELKCLISEMELRYGSKAVVDVPLHMKHHFNKCGSGRF